MDSVEKMCNAGRKNWHGRSSVGEITWLGVGLRSKVSKTNAGQRRNTSEILRSQQICKNNLLKLRDSCGKLRFPVQSSTMEIEPSKNAADFDTNSTRSPTSVMQELDLSSDTISDTASNSEAYGRLSYAVKDQQDVSESAIEGLRLLASVAVWKLENDQADACPEHTEGRASSQEWIRKAIFFLTGEPYLQKRVIRRARSAYRPKDDRSGHNNLYPANSEPIMADNAVSKSGKIEALDQAAGRPKRTRLQTMPAKYCDSVLQPWKKGARR